jgi:predicted RNase H-like HicB family nuclease
MKGKFTFTAHIEKDPDTGLYIGYIPSLPGAHTQAESLDELHKNLEEVASLCMEELTEQDLVKINEEFIGTQQVVISL